MPKRKKNPVPASRWKKIQKAIDLFQRFRGHDPEYLDSVNFPVPEVCLLVGELDGVLYTTVRDGVKESYIHKFKKSSRPLLATSYDGKQLYILGGGYTFTDAGIVDK